MKIYGGVEVYLHHPQPRQQMEVKYTRTHIREIVLVFVPTCFAYTLDIFRSLNGSIISKLYAI
jgi:hypothetical protein